MPKLTLCLVVLVVLLVLLLLVLLVVVIVVVLLLVVVVLLVVIVFFLLLVIVVVLLLVIVVVFLLVPLLVPLPPLPLLLLAPPPSQVPSLQLDRCILSRTRFVIPIISPQKYMQASFPANTHTCTLIVRLERRLNLHREAQLFHNDNKDNKDNKADNNNNDDDDETHLAQLKQYQNPSFHKKKPITPPTPESDLALSCTVVFRGVGYGLGGTTCRCVLPFPKMAQKLTLHRGTSSTSGTSSTASSAEGETFDDPMDVVRRGRRDDLVQSVVSRLRLGEWCKTNNDV